MQHAFRPSALVPPGFTVEEAVFDGATAVITVRSTATARVCPGCGGGSRRVYSHYAAAWQTCRLPAGPSDWN